MLPINFAGNKTPPKSLSVNTCVQMVTKYCHICLQGTYNNTVIFSNFMYTSYG